MNVQGKVWGKTQLLFASTNTEVHLIEAKKGGYCSRHYHATKYNRFIVLSGKLQVLIWKKYGSEVLVDITILTDGMQCTVDPMDEHMFAALEDTVALEVYYVELNPRDIVRNNHGGMQDG